MDNTVARKGLISWTRNMLIVGGGALVVLFFIAAFLSRRIIKPLEENDQRQKQFISDAGHELKTPISVISTNIELLSRQMDANEWLDNIRYENERMGEFVIQLLDLSRAENAEIIKEQIDLSRLFERFYRLDDVRNSESKHYGLGLAIAKAIVEGHSGSIFVSCYDGKVAFSVSLPQKNF